MTRLRSVLFALLFLAIVAQAQVTFFQPPTYGGTGNLFVADFNGDGKPDLLSGSTVELGNGNGTFTAGVTVSGTPLAVADFNGDGKPDILEQGTGTLVVLLGKGDGTFQSPISTNSGANLNPVAAGNLTANNEADVAGVFNGSLYVYLSNGNGTFAAGVPYNLSLPSGAAAVSIILGDVNGDGKTDVTVITVGDNVAGQVIVFLGNGDGTLRTPPLTSTGVYAADAFPSSVVEAPFNGGSFPDLAVNVAPICNGTCQGTYNISLLVGNGDGTFQAPTVAIPGVNGPLAVADFNGDGNLDLAVEADPTVAEVYLGNGVGAFSNSSNYILSLPGYPGIIFPSYMAVADFNLDGKPDIAAGNAVLLGNGDGTFQGVQFGIVPDYSGTIAVGDFQKNNRPDVAMLSSQEIGSQYFYNVYILSNNGGGLLSLINTYQLQEPGVGIVTADLNGDGNLDLLVTSNDPVTQEWGYSVLLGNGNGSFQSPVFYPQSIVSGQNFPVVGDFNNDGKLDFAVPEGNQTLAVLLGNGNGTFANPVYYFDGGNAAAIMAADFNGDGNLDIAAGSTQTGPPQAGQTAILYGNGNGTFAPAVFPASLNTFEALFGGDFNNDGIPDLFSGTQVALGNGNGTFTLQTPISCFPGSGENCPTLAIGDVNGDGILDVLTAVLFGIDFLGDVVFLGNGNGTFGPPVAIAGPQAPSTIMDMNGDGKADIVFPWSVGYWYLLGYGVNGVGVLLNTTPPGFDIFASALSPATVTAGNSATSTATIKPTFGFNGTVALSCSGLPGGASCVFNPPSIVNSSGASSLTISTSTSTAAGTYPVKIQGTSGPVVNSTIASLVVKAAPDFTVEAASGTSTSQTVNAGQSAKFSLVIGPSGSFTGTVNLSCSIKPVVTEGPTCSLSTPSLQITGPGGYPFGVSIGTTATSGGTISHVEVPPAPMPLGWLVGLLWIGLLLFRNRKWVPIFAASLVVLAMVSWTGCGGGGSSSSQTGSGTPSGTYTATVTATSGNLSHTTVLSVTVQ